MNRPIWLNETASQTAGPYVHIGLAPKVAGFDIFEKSFGNVLAQPDTPGERIAIEGRVIDGSGRPLRDVLLKLWQADSDGRYQHPADRQQWPRGEAFLRLGTGPLRFRIRDLALRDHQAGRS